MNTVELSDRARTDTDVKVAPHVSSCYSAPNLVTIYIPTINRGYGTHVMH